MPAVACDFAASTVALVDAEVAYLQARGAVSTTRSGLVAAILAEALAERRSGRAARASALLAQFIAVPRAVAAAAFRRCQGAVPIDELQSAAYEEALKAARRFRPEAVGATWETLGSAPAPYLRSWAERGVQALLRERQEEGQLVRPDGDDGDRWERLGGEELPDHAHALALRSALDGFSGARRRRVVGLLAHGADYDAIAARMGCPVEEVQQVLGQLHQHLQALGIEHAPDEELPLAEAAARKGVSPKALAKRLRSGRLRGRKLRGEWHVMASEV